jgi:predicted acylesterase/phospholipase RssA
MQTNYRLEAIFLSFSLVSMSSLASELETERKEQPPLKPLTLKEAQNEATDLECLLEDQLGSEEEFQEKIQRTVKERLESLKNAEAIGLYKKAAEKGIADAQYQLAILYEEGEGIEQDKSKAAQLYQQAAEKGHVLAQYHQELMNETGEALEKRFELSRKAAEYGYNKEGKFKKSFPTEEEQIFFCRENDIETHDIAGLAIDGGGIRGLIPAIWLEHLASKGVANRSIYRIFDVVGGTSIGGILAGGFTLPSAAGSKEPALTPQEAICLFRDKSEQIFPKGSILKRMSLSFSSLFLSEYDPTPLEYLLQGYFGQTTLNQALTNLIVVSADNHTQQPFIFSSREARCNPARNYEAWQVGRATSAAPTYFPTFTPSVLDAVGPQPELIDGGLYFNNPALEVYTEMVRLGDAQSQFSGRENMILLSLGTGQSRLPDCKFNHKSGLLSAARPAVEIYMRASSIGIHTMMQTHLPKRYKRINTELDRTIQLDNASEKNLNYLTEKAEQGKIIIEEFYEDILRPFLNKRD